MNKNSNTLFGSKQNNTVVKNIVEAEPALYGAAPSGSNQVKFAYHEGDAIANGEAGQIVFNKLNGTGAIVINGELVSSKILDVVAAQKSDASVGVKTISVKYVGADNAILTSTFEVVDEAAVKGWLNNINSDNNKKFGEIDASIADIKGYLDDTNIASATKDVVVTPTLADGDYKKTYDLKVNIDASTIMRDANGVLSAKKTIAIVEGAADTEEKGHKYLALKAENGVIENKIDLCDIVGTGLVKSASYNNTTNKLTLTLATADGAATKPFEIDLSELFDINDIAIQEDSSNYLTFTANVSTGQIGANMVSLLDGEGKPLSGIVANGLLDASVAKSYIDQKTTDLAVSASGDTYVDASVDADNNKHINVAAKLNELTVGKEDGADTTISGVSTTLVSGGEVASKVSTFTNARIDEEIKKLNNDVTSDDAAVATVEVVETAGKISDVVVTTNAAVVATGGDKDARTLTATLGTGAVLGSDLAVLKEFIKNVADDASANAFASAKAALDSSITGLDASLDATDASHYIHVGVAQEDGKIKGLVLDASVIDSSADLAAVDAAGKLVDAKAVKDLIDAKVDAQDSDVTVSDTFITAKIAMVDGALNQEQSSLSYQKAVYANDSNTVTTNGLVDGQLALNMINDRIADLDKAEETKADDNEYVSISLKVEDGLASITSVAVKTHEVSTATEDSEGLATAYGAKSYVDARLTWAVI